MFLNSPELFREEIVVSIASKARRRPPRSRGKKSRCMNLTGIIIFLRVKKESFLLLYALVAISIAASVHFDALLNLESQIKTQG